MQWGNERHSDGYKKLTEKRLREMREKVRRETERKRQYIRQVVIDCLAVVSKGTAMWCVWRLL